MSSMRPLLIVIAGLLASAAWAQDYSITFLHNNDGESKLTGYSDSLAAYGGVARFATLLDTTRTFYENRGHGVVAVYAGDTFLAGPQFQASLDSGVAGSRTFYDALAISRIGYDASILGNHEFDFGPDVLAEFIDDAQTSNPTTYLSANLDFSNEPALAARVASGLIAPSKVVTVATSAGDKRVGIIGVTTETLPFVSSPGAVGINSVATAVNGQIAALKAASVDHIVLASHLQGLATDSDLIANLDSGVELIIAGGGDEILVNSAASPLPTNAPATVASTGLIPGDTAAALSGSLTGVTNTYPLRTSATDRGGRQIPIATTGGNYGYLGQVTLQVTNGAVSIDASSNPQRVAAATEDQTAGVIANATVQAESVAPVETFVSGLAANVLATTSVQLRQGGSGVIRSRETNLGNLVADGVLRAAQQRAAGFGVDAPVIALVNGGGIRANVDVGNFTQLSTFSVSPFGNFVSVVEDVSLADLKLLLENAYSKTSDDPNTPGIAPVGTNGRFAQIAGMEVTYDITRAGLAFDSLGTITTPGQRVTDISIGGTAYLVADTWVNGVDPATTTVDVATLGFLAGGGDQYFRTAVSGTSTYLSQLYGFTTLGVTDHNALREFVDYLAAGNSGFDIASASPDYALPESVTGGRISVVPEPTLAGLLGVGSIAAAAWLSRRTRR